MTHALPAAPAPPPRRQVFVGTAVGSAAAMMLIGGMVGIWLLQRQRWLALDEGAWVPAGIEIPGVPTNVMLIAMLTIPVFAQWAVYAARRRERAHLGAALGLVGFLAIAVVNAQAYLYDRMDMAVADTGYAPMFYAITGVMTALIVTGIVFTAITAFRVLGGRDSDTELVAAHALWWYVVAALFSVVWLIVFVTK